jgi:site-specific recombinase XerD
LEAQFGHARVDWHRIGPVQIRQYAHAVARGRKHRTINHDLRSLHRFFTYLHIGGVVPSQWCEAVPCFSCYGETRVVTPLTDQQRRQLLASFDRRTSSGLRDYCLTVCMVDLGLRPVEVRRLSLSDLDWTNGVLHVPPTKTDRGRDLPLTPRIASALRTYVERKRPRTDSGSMFVRHHTSRGDGSLSKNTIHHVLQAAYARCGFPSSWSGGYRLRHTFATRLHARGVDLKNIADLLGHRHLQTTTIYAKVDINALRALAVPWPL